MRQDIIGLYDDYTHERLGPAGVHGPAGELAGGTAGVGLCRCSGTTTPRRRSCRPTIHACRSSDHLFRRGRRRPGLSGRPPTPPDHRRRAERDRRGFDPARRGRRGASRCPRAAVASLDTAVVRRRTVIARDHRPERHLRRARSGERRDRRRSLRPRAAVPRHHATPDGGSTSPRSRGTPRRRGRFRTGAATVIGRPTPGSGRQARLVGLQGDAAVSEWNAGQIAATRRRVDAWQTLEAAGRRPACLRGLRRRPASVWLNDFRREGASSLRPRTIELARSCRAAGPPRVCADLGGRARSRATESRAAAWC